MAFLADPVVVLAEFGRHIGIPGAVFDEGGRCRLGFDEVVLDIAHQESSGHLIISAEVAALPESPHESLLSRYLALNYLALIMGAGGISIDEEKRAVMFVSRVSLRGLDIETFEREMARIVDRAEALIETVASPDFCSSAIPVSDLPPFMHFTLCV